MTDTDRLLAAATPRPWYSDDGEDGELAALAVNEYEALLECAAALARLCEFTADNGYAPSVDHSPSWSRAWAALADLAELRGAE